MSTEIRKRATATPASGRYSTTEEFLAASGVSKAVQKEVKALSNGSRLTAALAVARTQAGITQAQMAEHLGVSESAVEARLHRARQRLRGELRRLDATLSK